MDNRKALKAGTKLNFRNSQNGIVEYTIQRELGRGGSCIVYDAVYVNNVGENRAVRIKECYPHALNITRNDSGELIPHETDYNQFCESCSALKESFSINNQLFNEAALSNSITNTVDIYSANNTVYIVTTYHSGQTLDKVDVSKLQDAVKIVTAVAKTVSHIHRKGYLYLDIKPSNVFIYDGIKDAIQLFDFDSLIPISSLISEHIENFRISYSTGFSAPEQKSGRTKQIGKHSDIFGVGALMFYLIFGYAPNAFECDKSAVYDFGSGKYNTYNYQDRLFRELTTFFHKSLANYYGSRYVDLDEAIEQLEVISRLSDEKVAFIGSTYGIKQEKLVGREEELCEIQRLLNTGNHKVFVSGMGGIGKSAIVRKYIELNRNQYDSVTYLFYNGSALKMINDDVGLHINTVDRSPDETDKEYFDRKIRYLVNLLRDTSALLVVDDFTGEIDKEFRTILSLNWDVIVIARLGSPADSYPEIAVGAIKKTDDLQHLFKLYLDRDLSPNEHPLVNDIVKSVNGHTYALGLIAKQVSSSHLTLEEAYERISSRGFTQIAPEQIKYEKDGITSSDTITNIIDKIFPMEEDLQKIVKGLSLFNPPGIPIDMFAKMIKLKSKDDINRLIEECWIELNGDNIYLHSVMRELANTWGWNGEYHRVLVSVIEYLIKRLKLEGKQEEYPLKLLQNFEDSPESKRQRIDYYKNKGLAGEIYAERIMRGSKEAVSDPKTVNMLLIIAMDVLSCCRKIDRPANSYLNSLYLSLLYLTTYNTARDREDYILSNSLELLESKDAIGDIETYNVYDWMANIYDDRRAFDKAWNVIISAKEGLHSKDNYIKAKYYDMRAGFYDSRLDGEYQYDNRFRDRKALLADGCGNAVCVSLPRGSVRILEHSDKRNAFRAGGAHRRVPRALAHVNRAFDLCAARMRDADRPFRQERHPHGGVRKAGAQIRQEHIRSRDERCGSPLPGGDDDGLELHLRRASARVRNRRGRGGDARNRNMHVLRDAGGDARGDRFRAVAVFWVPASA